MDSILDRFADNLTDVTYITNPAVARDDEIKILTGQTEPCPSAQIQKGRALFLAL